MGNLEGKPMIPNVAKPTYDRWLVGFAIAFLICVIAGVIETVVPK